MTTSRTPADDLGPPTGDDTEIDLRDPAVRPRRASKRGRAAVRRQAAGGRAVAAAGPEPPPVAETKPVPDPVPPPTPTEAPAPTMPTADASDPPAPAGEPRDGVVGEFVGLVASGGFAPPEPPAPEPAEADPPPADPFPRHAPAARRRGPGARRLLVRRRLVAGAMVVLVGLGAGLVVVGLDRVRGSTAGTYVDARLQPDEPGYVALVTPTPTMLLLGTDAEGQLAGVALLSLRSQDEGGSVVLIPAATQAPFAEEGTDLRSVFADAGASTVETQIELMLNLSIGETVELDGTGWASLVRPLGSISMVLPAAVGEWPAGPVELAADDVGRFLATRSLQESELARVDRQELFWEEWLPRVAAEGDDALPGESDVGVGRFVRGLAAGESNVEALPVAQVQPANAELFGLTEDLAADLIAREIPFPQEPSVGSRIRVRLLNGTSESDLAALAAGPLVEAGAEIALSGNASSFDEPETRIIYSKARLRREANSLRDALGIGVVEQAESDESVEPGDEADRIDVTVVLGADAPEVIRRLESTG